MLIVKAKKGEAKGELFFNGKPYPCAIGPAGMVAEKKEGDGGTPIAEMRLVRGFYRADRLERPETKLPLAAIQPDYGWCDDPASPHYNAQVKLPFTQSHEVMWRDDHVYDICIVLDWNLEPAVAGKGSAIFFHLAREGYTPTEGCIVVSLEDMLEILRSCDTTTIMRTETA